MSRPDGSTERLEYERKLAALHDVATDLAEARSVAAVCERTVAASEEILSFDTCVVGIEDDGVLYPEATSSGVQPDGVGPIPIEEGLGGWTYRTGESALVTDVDQNEYAKPKGAYESAISVAIGDHGNFQAVAGERDAFGEADLRLAELLAEHAKSALDRLDSERRLERQKERLEEYASVVAHDIRNPLEVAKGHVALGKRDADDGVADHLDEAETALHRMELLTDDLLTLARQGKRPMTPETIDLAEFAEDCWAEVGTADTSLVVETTRTVQADPERLRRLLKNLFRNAVEHGSTGSQAGPGDAVEHGSTGRHARSGDAVAHDGSGVTVTVGDLEDGFYVTDDGSGLPAGKHEAVFDAGYTTVEEGTGLGLRIVRDVAEVHGWSVAATDAPGGGARFEVTGVESE